MALVAFNTASPYIRPARIVAGNKRFFWGTATLASGTNYVDVGLNFVEFATAYPVLDLDSGGAGSTITVKRNTAEGTEGDARGKVTIESATALDYVIFAIGY